MEKSESIKNLAMALVKFHSIVGKIKKDSTNPFFKSKYADLSDIQDAISAPLIESGLVLSQLPMGKNELTTILIHSESGEYIMGSYEMNPVKNDPQSVGSCITYQKRYAVGAILNLNMDADDDGNAASKLPPASPVAPATPVAPSPSTITKPLTKPVLNETDKESWSKVVVALAGGKTMADIRTKWAVSKGNEAKLLAQSKKQAA